MTAFSPVPPPLTGIRLMAQDWRRLTFVHWAVDPDVVAPLLPPQTSPDVLDGVTCVGLIPFEMRRAELEHLDDGPVAAAGLAGVADREPDSVLHSAGVRTVFGTPVLVRA